MITFPGENDKFKEPSSSAHRHGLVYHLDPELNPHSNSHLNPDLNPELSSHLESSITFTVVPIASRPLYTQLYRSVQLLLYLNSTLNCSTLHGYSVHVFTMQQYNCTVQTMFCCERNYCLEFVCVRCLCVLCIVCVRVCVCVCVQAVWPVAGIDSAQMYSSNLSSLSSCIFVSTMYIF